MSKVMKLNIKGIKRTKKPKSFKKGKGWRSGYDPEKEKKSYNRWVPK